MIYTETVVYKNVPLYFFNIIPVFFMGFYTFCTNGNREEYPTM